MGAEIHHHRNKHRLERAERTAEMMPIIFVVGLAVALVIGLLTSTGHVTW